MNYQNIDEVFTANDQIRENLKKTLANVTDNQANFLPEGEKWTVAALVEHLALAERGMMQVSARLLSKAQAESQTADGKLHITQEFAANIGGVEGRKFEAPAMVQPTGTQPIAESLKQLDESRRQLNELHPLFESVAGENFTFPHPAFGELNAHEWLALIGGHESRHTRQIEKMIETMA